MDDHPQVQLFLAVGAEMQDILPGRQRDPVLPVPVAPGVGFRNVVIDDHAVHRLPGLGFRHGAANPIGRTPFVLARDSYGVNLVPIGCEKGRIRVLDCNGIFLNFSEIGIR